MTKILPLLITFFVISTQSFGVTQSIFNIGTSFLPNHITINLGDDVQFNLDLFHNVVEVSNATYNAYGNTPLAGGFSTPYGGGLVAASSLTTGVHYFVCAPHAAAGMIGTITVVNNVSTNIQIANINVVNTECAAQISWVGEDEDDIDFYELQYTQDPSQGFAEGEKIYPDHTLDKNHKQQLNLDAGTYYLRLSATHKDGQIHYSSTEEVHISCDNTVLISKTLSDQSIRVSHTYTGDQVSLYDILGKRLLYVEAIGDETALNYSRLYEGVYYVTVHRLGSLIYSSPIHIRH